MNVRDINKLNSLLVITSYPDPDDKNTGDQHFNAVGWHSQKTLKGIAKNNPVVVCAEKRDSSQDFSPHKNLYVKRIWEKSNPFSFINLFSSILRLNNVKTILVQFEFNVFGGILPNIALLIMLLLLRLTGRRIIFELHQVILDISLLEKHINIKNPVKQKFFDQCLRMFYVLLGLTTTAIIVFEQELKNRLKPMIAKQKIHVLPLAVEAKDFIPKTKARECLQLDNDRFILLVFGFINGYKGIDWIIPALSSLDKNKFKLIIAGGENPYLKDKEFYQKFYHSIVEEVEKNPNVTLTGFIPEDEIKYYFHAADLVLMPYTVFMSASGPFSLTLGYGKPILLSEKLIEYTHSNDFKTALDQSGLTTSDLYFSLKDTHSLIDVLTKYSTDSSALQKLTDFSVHLAHLRDSDNILKEYTTILFPQTKPAFIKASRPSFLKIP